MTRLRTITYSFSLVQGNPSFSKFNPTELEIARILASLHTVQNWEQLSICMKQSRAAHKRNLNACKDHKRKHQRCPLTVKKSLMSNFNFFLV